MPTIGKLNAILSLDGDGFTKSLAAAKQQAVGFSKDVTQHINLAGKSFAGLGGIASGVTGTLRGSLTALTAGLGAFTAAIPGLSIFGAAIAHPLEAAERAMQRTVELAKDAEDIGVGTQFMRALQLAAGPEAEAASKAMLKLMNLKSTSGNTDSSEKFIRDIIAQGAALKNADERIAFAASKVGIKSAMGLVELFQKGPSGLDEKVNKMQELNMYTAEQVQISEAWKKVQKDINLEIEAFEQKNMFGGGQMITGLKRVLSGDPRGMKDLKFGSTNWMLSLLGFGPNAPPEMIAAMNAPKEDEGEALREAFGMASSQESSQKLGDAIEHWQRLGETIGMAAEDAALYNAQKDFAGMPAPWLKQLEDAIKLAKQSRIANDEMLESMRMFDHESERMTQHADSRRANARHPFAKLLDSGDLMGGFRDMEKQFNTNPAVQLAGAYGGGSREAYSILASASVNGSQGDLASRVQAVKEAIDANKRAVEMGNAEIKPILQQIADSQPGVATN